MQYLLEKEEYQELKKKDRLQDIIAKEKLQKLCTQVADHMPVLFWGRKNPEPWRCIHTIEDEWFCDECPVQDVCPSQKHYSK